MGVAAGAAAPEASMTQVSLVELSESTVTLLNVMRTADARAACRARGTTGASVVMTAIIVAMLGMIMPEPLHMPPTVNRAPSYPGASLAYATAHSFARVSVVMIARAAACAPLA